MCLPAEPPNGEVQLPAKSGRDYGASELAKEDEWISKFDAAAFKSDVLELGKTLAAQQGPDDVAHLRKIMLWSRACFLIGLCTMWYCINPISIYLVSIGIMSRWAIIGHHICHGGFDKCSGGTYNRFKFGVRSTWRRVVDWLDWMLVEAWNVEHNQLHHYCLGELSDPDLVEENLKTLRNAKAPMPVKYMAVGFFMATWKWLYYAPNTFKMLKVHEARRQGKTPMWRGKPVSKKMLEAPWPIFPTWAKSGPIFFTNVEFFGRVLGPFFFRQFVLLPALFGLALGKTAYFNTLVSLVLAEIMTNIHSFIVIVPNHAGDDLYRFEQHCTARSATFYLRQVISSANFTMGTDLIDFHHGWLNYQVEHHLWPDLSMLSYQKAAPMVKAICAKHGVPYIQQSVFWRLKKTVDIMTGAASMRKYPRKWEVQEDLTSADDIAPLSATAH